jgi:hypothetical protein
MAALSVWERLVSCEFERMPPAVQGLHLSRPVCSAPVQVHGSGFRLRAPEAWAEPATTAMYPKLGIKSWRDAGGLGVIYVGVPLLAVVAPLLRAPTQAQRVMVRAWQRAGQTLQVHLWPYQDFADVTEARYLVRGGVARATSVCLRGASAPRFAHSAARLQRLAQDVAEQLAPAPWIIDLAVLPDDSLKVVEVNPALGPRELTELRHL